MNYVLFIGVITYPCLDPMLDQIINLLEIRPPKVKFSEP